MTNMDNSTKPLVSICAITYNHVSYIRDCLNGFLIQQTDFPFEIIIHDDASTDGTTDIIREYSIKYPDIIRPIIQPENQYSKHKRFDIIIKSCIDRTQGKYIAFCEGDDYWTDPLKLQKQVDYLETHPKINLCYTEISFLNMQTGKTIPNFLQNGNIHSSPKFEKHMLHPGFIAPCTWLFRKKNWPTYNKIYSDLTYPIALDFMAVDSVYFLNENTAVYRFLEESASHSRNKRKLYDYAKGILRIQLEYIDKYKTLLTPNLKRNIMINAYRRILFSAIAFKDTDVIADAKNVFEENNFHSTIIMIVLSNWKLFRPIICFLKKFKSRY